MRLSDFYAAVLPDEGKYVIAAIRRSTENGKPRKHIRHIVCDSLEEARQTTAALVKRKICVHYALASYRQGFHTGTKGRNVVRVRDNVCKLKALWFDIDFKGGLSDPTEVVAVLREFCSRTRMPAPSILVHSGNGVHVHWVLRQSIDLAQWQPIADSLKAAAKSLSIPVDFACISDSCRMPRPPGTRNYKAPETPKPVKPLYFSDKQYDHTYLEAVLASFNGSAAPAVLGTVPEYLHSTARYDPSLESGPTPYPTKSYLANIAKKCGVVAHYFATAGADCSEPEWVAGLQLAKHCDDGELHYHAISEGYAGYDREETDEKWGQRLANAAGPTLCDTFAGYRPDICKLCPHRGLITTPLALGEESMPAAPEAPISLQTWRPAKDNMGMERKLFNPDTKQYMWEKVLGRTWELNCAAADIISGAYTLTVTSKLGKARPITVDLAGRLLGDAHTLKKELGDSGCPIQQNEVTTWVKLMTTWLESIQQQRKVSKSIARMGWIEERTDKDTIETIGFSAGNTSWLVDGTTETNLRVAGEYREIARHYLPRGEIQVWQEAANFIARQDNPGFTAILASAFATPLFGFTGMPGAMLTIVSTLSGIGKSSAMRTAQAVWGSPSRGMNSTSDTYLSIVRKVAFLKNLPVYWDEIRGQAALESFYKTAFDVAQGKERTRLSTAAEMREINDWKTMVIGAANESVFDFMAQEGGASNAAMARTFEVEVGPFDDPSRAAHNAMFARLDANYGCAGQVYGKFLSANSESIATTVRTIYESLYTKWGFREGERFWCAIIASLLAGAAFAHKAGIVSVNVTTLRTYLRNRMAELRVRSGQVLSGCTAREIVIGYLQANQDAQMITDGWPVQGSHTEPLVISAPKSNKLSVVRVGNTYRFLKRDFTHWLKRDMRCTFSSLERELGRKHKLLLTSTVLGARTKWALPKAQVIEVTLDDK